MEDDLRELAGLAVAAKLLAEAILIERVRTGEMSMDRARGVITGCLRAVEERRQNPRDDAGVLDHAQRALASSEVSLAGSTGVQSPGRA
jgi:hypothetical protein